MKVLVVDDELATRRLYERFLSARGHEVTACERAEVAWANFEREGADLVLLDWMLPGMSGVELCGKIRLSRRGRSTVVVMVTARADPDDLKKGLDAGADDYIVKPVDLDLLDIRLQVAERNLRHRLERNAAEDALRESEERYALAAAGANDALWDWNFETDQIYFSPRWYETLGFKNGELPPVSGSWFGRIHPDDRERVEQVLKDHLSGASSHFETEYRIRSKDGSYRWVLSRGIAVMDDDDRPIRMAGSHTDLTMRGVHDALTGLPNRALFMERLRSAVEVYKRRGESPFALLFIDLDRFKMVNDSLGHHVGDELLVAVAERLKKCIRPGDGIARFGGDEFTILLDHVENPRVASEVAGRITAVLADPVQLEGQEVFPAASVGIVLSNSSYRDADEMLRDADTAMYRAKAGGGGRYELFADDMRSAAVARMQLANDLRRTVAKEELQNFYQPIIALKTGQLAGFEALVRWYHPLRGFVPAEEFVPLAEELGLIADLGKLVTRRACERLGSWVDRYGRAVPLTMAVNLSPKQFLEPNLLDWMRETLAHTAVDPARLDLEVTESAIIDDLPRAREILHALKDLGVRVCLDDFGTGYSSLKHLHQLPIDKLKVDRSFVVRFGTDKEITEIVRSIVELARKLQIDVVAEGVEDRRHEQLLKALGVKYGQGYLYAMPLDEAQASFLLDREVQQLAKRRSA